VRIQTKRRACLLLLFRLTHLSSRRTAIPTAAWRQQLCAPRPCPSNLRGPGPAFPCGILRRKQRLRDLPEYRPGRLFGAGARRRRRRRLPHRPAHVFLSPRGAAGRRDAPRRDRGARASLAPARSSGRREIRTEEPPIRPPHRDARRMPDTSKSYKRSCRRSEMARTSEDCLRRDRHRKADS